MSRSKAPPEMLDRMSRLGSMMAESNIADMMSAMEEKGAEVPANWSKWRQDHGGTASKPLAPKHNSSHTFSSNSSASPHIPDSPDHTSIDLEKSMRMENAVVAEAERQWMEEISEKPQPFVPSNFTDINWQQWNTAQRVEVENLSTSGKGQMWRPTVGHDKYFSMRSLAELKPINLREMHCPKRHAGYYLICRTVYPAARRLSLQLIVEDTKGDIIIAALYNLPETFQANLGTLEAHFPPGTVLAIREPWIELSGSPGVIHVDSPSDVIFLSPNADALASVRWSKPSPPVKTAANWKLAGDDLFKRQFYLPAARAWSHAYNLDPFMATVPLNRSQAYLKLGWFSAALGDAELALHSQISPSQMAKALFRAASAEYGLGLYKQAIARCKASKDIAFADERKTLLHSCASRIREANGTFNIVKMQKDAAGMAVTLDVANYVSPAICVGPFPECGGGREIKATRPIQTGELLMVHSPYAVVTDDQLNRHEKVSAPNFVTRLLDHAGSVGLVNTIAGLVLSSPSDSKRITELYAGPRRPQPPPTYDLKLAAPSHGDVIDPLAWAEPLDISVIEGIIMHNAVEISPLSSLIDYDKHNERGNAFLASTSASALYTAPSMFNHDCDGNAARTYIGTTMLVRATQDIQLGAEITIPYLHTHGYTFTDRKRAVRSYFPDPCICTMCSFERDIAGGEEACRKRRDIFSNGNLTETSIRECLKEILATYPAKALKTMTRQGIPQPILYYAYSAMNQIMATMQSTAIERVRDAKLQEAIQFAFKALEAGGFTKIDMSMNASESERFVLPLSQERLGLSTLADSMICTMVRIALGFTTFRDKEVCVERWIRAAWWAHNAYYGGGEELFKLRMGYAWEQFPKPENMEYRWE
ncbi:hypothetical protein CYLTODRAFT_422228 [Cylindrobasidium torrendii FP15055 ss-10]|uniref:SET domain-containing protein n=1 Tax=Cylindrobasidium torrendii FP15055 ss-10 TaxID=1314674 RepID=A0A0D7BC20_9AGAR|nr:hypothetical protein CYLTODRAFT_422228 [Cylindrobasidium torrendii FP15055 ss-10]